MFFDDFEDFREFEPDDFETLNQNEADDYRNEGDEDRYFDRDDEFDIDFADPGGRSALRAATEDNPRNLPCPNCGAPNRLTPADRARHYQCDTCADRAERGID